MLGEVVRDDGLEARVGTARVDRDEANARCRRVDPAEAGVGAADVADKAGIRDVADGLRCHDGRLYPASIASWTSAESRRRRVRAARARARHRGRTSALRATPRARRGALPASPKARPSPRVQRPVQMRERMDEWIEQGLRTIPARLAVVAAKSRRPTRTPAGSRAPPRRRSRRDATQPDRIAPRSQARRSRAALARTSARLDRIAFPACRALPRRRRRAADRAGSAERAPADAGAQIHQALRVSRDVARREHASAAAHRRAAARRWPGPRRTPSTRASTRLTLPSRMARSLPEAERRDRRRGRATDARQLQSACTSRKPAAVPRDHDLRGSDAGCARGCSSPGRSRARSTSSSGAAARLARRETREEAARSSDSTVATCVCCSMISESHTR